jgi:hypothetical protein
MAGSLEVVPSLKGKKVVFLAIHFLFYGRDRKQMLQSMKAACREKGAKIIGISNVPRLSYRQNKYIEDVVMVLENENKNNRRA